MEWNLLPVLHCDGKKMPLEVSLELAPHAGDEFRILGAVDVCGEIVNIGGTLELTATGKARLERVCDRCAEAYETEVTFPIAERIKKVEIGEEENQDPDLMVLEGNSLEAEELVYRALYMNLPSKALCDEACKGLCAQCGQNLNHGRCSCDDRPTDPRFDVLDQLL